MGCCDHQLQFWAVTPTKENWMPGVASGGNTRWTAGFSTSSVTLSRAELVGLRQVLISHSTEIPTTESGENPISPSVGVVGHEGACK